MIIEFLLIFPLLGSIFLLIFKSRNISRLLLFFYSVSYFFASLYLCYCVYFNIKVGGLLKNYFAADPLNIIFLLILSTVFLAVSVYNDGYVKVSDMKKSKLSYYSIGVLLFVFSMTGTILSTNMALSWVFVEATTLTSAYLIYFERTKQSMEAAWKYVFICSIGISLGFVGIILLSIATADINSLFFSDLYSHAANINKTWLNLAFVFFLIGIGTKVGLAPVHSWLPDAHSEAPSPVSALLSAVLLNTAFLLIIRFFHITVLAENDGYGRILMIAMGIMSLFVTAVYVFTTKNYKRMLAYSSIENMGIIALGTALGGPAVIAAMIHLVFHSLIKSSFFLTAGNILKIFHTKRTNEIHSIIKIDKFTGWLWIGCFIGIAGIPPSPLFISEFLMVKAMILNKHFLLMAVFLILLTIIIFGMAKRIIYMSYGKDISEAHNHNGHGRIFNVTRERVSLSPLMYLPQIILLLISALAGLYMPGILSKLLEQATSLI